MYCAAKLNPAGFHSIFVWFSAIVIGEFSYFFKQWRYANPGQILLSFDCTRDVDLKKHPRRLEARWRGSRRRLVSASKPGQAGVRIFCLEAGFARL